MTHLNESCPQTFIPKCKPFNYQLFSLSQATYFVFHADKQFIGMRFETMFPTILAGIWRKRMSFEVLCLMTDENQTQNR